MQVNPNLQQNQSTHSASVLHGVSASARQIAQRHFQRAKEQIKLRHTTEAIQELRGAVQADPLNSEYHALLGKVQLEKGLTGMAAISLRQALKLNPEDAIAVECMKKLNAQSTPPTKQDFASRIMGILTKKL